MSVKAMMWGKRTKVGDPTRKSILLVLCDYADEAASCFPSQATIAEEAEASERTVRRVLAEFETIGLLRRERRSDGHYGRSSDRIFLDLEWAPATQTKTPDPDLQPANVTACNPGAAHLQPVTQSTQPVTDDRATGQALAGEPTRTDKEPRTPSSSNTHARAAAGSDDGYQPTIVGMQAGRLYAIDRLDSRRRSPKPLPDVGDVNAWLNRVAANWVIANAVVLDAYVEAFPGATADDLVAHVRDRAELAVLEPDAERPRRIARAVCATCAGSTRTLDDECELIPCPDCQPVSARKATA